MKLDHIVIAAASLEQGRAFSKKTFGVVIPDGGEHPLMGTHNLFTRIARGCFLEIIAIHPTLPAKRPRWFGLDDPTLQAQIAIRPKLVGWVMGVGDMDTVLKSFPFDAGASIEATRGDLKWHISVTADGRLSLGGVVPLLIDWGGGEDGIAHPSHRMADVGVRLQSFELICPEAQKLSQALQPLLGANAHVKVSLATEHQLKLQLQTPKGLVQLHT